MRPITLLIFLIANFSYGQKFTNLAQTPPMGWNNWNRLGCDINVKAKLKGQELELIAKIDRKDMNQPNKLVLLILFVLASGEKIVDKLIVLN